MLADVLPGYDIYCSATSECIGRQPEPVDRRSAAPARRRRCSRAAWRSSTRSCATHRRQDVGLANSLLYQIERRFTLGAGGDRRRDAQRQRPRPVSSTATTAAGLLHGRARAMTSPRGSGASTWRNSRSLAVSAAAVDREREHVAAAQRPVPSASGMLAPVTCSRPLHRRCGRLRVFVRIGGVRPFKRALHATPCSTGTGAVTISLAARRARRSGIVQRSAAARDPTTAGRRRVQVVDSGGNVEASTRAKTSSIRRLGRRAPAGARRRRCHEQMTVSVPCDRRNPLQSSVIACDNLSHTDLDFSSLNNGIAYATRPLHDQVPGGAAGRPAAGGRAPQPADHPEHLLAVLLEQDGGVVVPVLRKLGVEPGRRAPGASTPRWKRCPS